MDVPFESAVRGSLEGSRGDRILVPATRRTKITPTALHHYQGRNSAWLDVEIPMLLSRAWISLTRGLGTPVPFTVAVPHGREHED